MKITRNLLALGLSLFLLLPTPVLAEREEALLRILQEPQGRTAEDLNRAYTALARMYNPGLLGPGATDAQKQAAQKKMADLVALRARALDALQPRARAVQAPVSQRTQAAPAIASALRWNQAKQENPTDILAALDSFAAKMQRQAIEEGVQRVIRSEEIDAIAQDVVRNWNSVLIKDLPERGKFSALIRSLAAYDEGDQKSPAWQELRGKAKIIAERVIEVGDPRAALARYRLSGADYLDALESALYFAPDQADAGRLMGQALVQYPKHFSSSLYQDLLDHSKSRLIDQPHADHLFERLNNAADWERPEVLKKALEIAQRAANSPYGGGEAAKRAARQERYQRWASELEREVRKLPLQGTFGSRLQGAAALEVVKVLQGVPKVLKGVSKQQDKEEALRNLHESMQAWMERLPSDRADERVAVAEALGVLSRELATGGGTHAAQADALRAVASEGFGLALSHAPGPLSDAAVRGFQGRLGGYRVAVSADFPMGMFNRAAPQFGADASAARAFIEKLIPAPEDARGLERLFPAREPKADRLVRATRLLRALDAHLPQSNPDEANFKAAALDKIKKALSAAGHENLVAGVDGMVADLKSRYPELKTAQSSRGGGFWNLFRSGGASACFAVLGHLL